MGLRELIQSIQKERKEFTDSFRANIRSKTAEADLLSQTKEYILEALIDGSMTRYYRFSVTLANELKGFEYTATPDTIQEMKYGLGLMLFWLRIADSYIDTSDKPSGVIEQVNNFLDRGNPPPAAQDPMTEALFFAANLWRNHGLQNGYHPGMIKPLKAMTDAMQTEIKNPIDIRSYCNARAQTGVALADTLLAIMRPFIQEQNIARFERFYHSQFKAGMLLDALADFSKDYRAGIAPKPSVQNKIYISWKLVEEIGRYLIRLPKSLQSAVTVISHSAFSTYNILRDAPTPG